MQRLSLFVFPLITASTLSALAEDRPQSIMFDHTDDKSDLTTSPARAADRSERCAELARQVDALKGKPQRRFAASQRYEAECQR